MEAAEDGIPIAIAEVEEAPKLDTPLYHHAFAELGTERNNSAGGLGPIPIKRMYWYADEVLGMDLRETEAFVYIMRRLDAHYLEKHREKTEQKTRLK